MSFQVSFSLFFWFGELGIFSHPVVEGSCKEPLSSPVVTVLPTLLLTASPSSLYIEATPGDLVGRSIGKVVIDIVHTTAVDSQLVLSSLVYLCSRNSTL
jgi:hypothetical protein